MNQLIKLAFRDLQRNLRRSIFSALALAIGVTLLVVIFSFVNGEMKSVTEDPIRLLGGTYRYGLNPIMKTCAVWPGKT